MKELNPATQGSTGGASGGLAGALVWIKFTHQLISETVSHTEILTLPDRQILQ